MKKPVCRIDSSGNKRWYLNGKFHRDDDLPAIEYVDGTKCWYQNGKRHRIQGAAIEYVSGSKLWCLNGEIICCFSQEEFKKYLLTITFK